MNVENAYMSESELGRVLNVPAPRLRKTLLARGIRADIVPNPKLHLFNRNRIAEIRQAVSQ